MREFEERFITNAIPYRVIGGPRFYERAEIRDALAYLKCVASPSQDLAFERIFNTPKRGLGDAVLQALHAHARQAGVPIMQAAQNLVDTEEIKPKQRQVLRELLASFERWRQAAQTLPQNELAELVLEESGYTDLWKRDRSPDAAGRLENLKELVRSMEEFENLAGFLEHVALVMEVSSENGEARVSIMTLHAAKGLEFDTVFLPGWEEGVFPHQRALDEQGKAGLEEERRLAYVGLTRAKKRARLSFTANRRIHGLWQAALPSRFLNELPEAHVEIAEGMARAPSVYAQGAYSRIGGGGGFGASDYATPGWQRGREYQAQRNAAAPMHSPYRRAPDIRAPQSRDEGLNLSANGPDSAYGRTARPLGRMLEGQAQAVATAQRFEVGGRVFHLKFGPGTVEALEGNRVNVAFDKAGHKMVIDSFLEKT